MDENNEEPRRETNYELEDRLRRQRSREKYLEQHPYHKDREEINPVEVLIELSKDYFANNEATEFKLEKALLGSRLDKKATATEFLCKKLEADFDFITNTKLGFLIIERHSFEDWLKLIEERKSQVARVRSINEEYPALIKDIEEREEALKKAEGRIAEMRGRKDQLTSQIAKIEEDIKGLPEQINAIEEKKNLAKIEFEKAEAEKVEKQKELESQLKEQKEEMKRRENERIWFFRGKINDYYIDKSPIEKFRGELIRYIVYGLIFHMMIYAYWQVV